MSSSPPSSSSPSSRGSAPMSVRAKLMLWLLIPSVCLWIAAAGGSFFITSNLTQAMYDDGLEDSVRTLASRLRTLDSGEVLLDLSEEALSIFEADETDSIYFQIASPDGKVISGDKDLPLPPSPGSRVTFSNTQAHGEDLRIASIMVPLKPPARDKFVTVQVAQTSRGRSSIIRQTLSEIALPVTVMALLALLAIWYAVKRGLAPLEQVAERVAKRSVADLRPIDTQDAPLETKPLLEAINGLLARLEAGINVQRRFIENAAHQLRTPLTVLKTRIQLVLREPVTDNEKQNLEDLRSGIDRMTRLVQQLLALARAEPGAAQYSFQTVNLQQLVRETARELVPLATRKHIELGYDGVNGEAFIDGDAAALREMISNVIDNAIRYTPAGGIVNIKLISNGALRLVVEDSGPGISKEERKRVFERFYRLPGSQSGGTGLGLSIVREIADRHGAKIEILDRPEGDGAVFVLSFPRASARKAVNH